MRELLSHRPNRATQQLSIHATDQPGAGGANHRYVISGYDATVNPSADPRVIHDTPIVFQNGVLKEAGANGVTNEALLAIVEDRLASFQAGPFACDENADALHNVRMAIGHLNARTERRVGQGIEGTHIEDPKPTGLEGRLKEGKPETGASDPSAKKSVDDPAHKDSPVTDKVVEDNDKATDDADKASSR